MTSFHENGDHNCNFLKVAPNIKPFIRDQRGSGVCGWTLKVATGYFDSSYATKDLFQEHGIKGRQMEALEPPRRYFCPHQRRKGEPDPNLAHRSRKNYAFEVVVSGAGKQQVGSFVILSENS